MALNNAFGSIKPSQKQQLLSDNYLSFTDGSGNDFAQQYLPEIYEQEVERYGNRTLSGFLRMVGAEMPMTSDQVVWSEQNRLHIAYNGVTVASATTLTFALDAATGEDFVGNVISKNDTIVIMDPSNGLEVTALVIDSVDTSATLATLTVATYTGADLDATFNVADTGLKIFVYGSEYKKGTGDADIKSITPSFTQFSNSPIIIKDKYAISGSDAAQIGWVEVATGSGVAAIAGDTKYKGTEGLFAAVKSRGNIFAGFAPAAGVLTEFDQILKNLDTQGAIEENMLFVNRQLSLTIDNMLGGVSAGPNGGVAYGLFENSEDMALNLGFSGFRRGSYDFYKTDWKYLNDASTRGAVAESGIEGILVPAGTSTVYDQILGTNIRRPFLHVRYRASQSDDRRMKSWLTGSVGGAYTSDLDAMEVHFLSERCLCVQAANNFVLFTD